MRTSTLIDKMLKLIDSPEKWIKDTFGLTADGDIVDDFDIASGQYNPVCYCTVGAMCAIYKSSCSTPKVRKSMNRVNEYIGTHVSLVGWNDSLDSYEEWKEHMTRIKKHAQKVGD